MSDVSPVRPTVVVIGGGYGGANVAKALDDALDVILVEPKDAFVHNVAGLRASGRVVRDRAVKVEPGRVTLASGTEIPADYIVLATGSAYPFPAKSDVDGAADAHAKVRAAHAALSAAQRVLLVGAGPVGI